MISVDMRPPNADRVPGRRAGPPSDAPDAGARPPEAVGATKAGLGGRRGGVRTVRRTSGQGRSPVRPAGRARRGGAALIVLCAAGCLRAEGVEVPTPSADEIQYAGTLVYREGLRGLELLRIEDGGLLRAGEQRVTRTATGARSLVVWTIDRRAFVHPDGRALSAAEFETLVIRAAGTPSRPDRGRCGRCLVPNAGEPPLVVHSGSSCAPPTKGGVRVVFDAGSAPLRSALEALALEAVRFEWAGACACTPTSLSASGGLDVAVTGEPAVRAHNIRIPTSSASLVLLDALGGVRVGDPRPAPPRTPEGLPLTGVALGSAADQTLLAGVLRGQLRFDLTWHRYDPASAMWDELFATPLIEPRGAVAVPSQPGQFLVFGQLRDFVKSAIVQVCRADVRACASLLSQVPGLGDERFLYAAALADGGWAFATDRGDVTYVDHVPALASAQATAPVADGRPETSPAGARVRGRTGRAPDVARWGSYSFDRVETSPGTSFAVAGLRGLAAVGQRVYACLTTDGTAPDALRTIVVSRELTPAALDAAAEGPNLGFRVEACRYAEEGTCRGLVTTGTVVHALLDRGEAYEVLRFDRDGPLDDVALRTPTCPSTPPDQRPHGPTVRFGAERFRRIQQVAPDAWLGAMASGEVARVDGRGVQWLYGEATPRPEWTVVLPDEQGGAWLLGPADLLGRWRPTTGLEVTALAGLPPIRAAALDHAEPAPALGFVAIAQDGRVVRLSVDGAPARTRVEVLPVGSAAQAVQIVEAVPGVHVAIAGRPDLDEAEIWRIRRGHPVEVAKPPPDDPRTDGADPQPDELSPASRCDAVPRYGDLLLAGTKPRTLRGLAASLGVVWAAGCGGELYRVIAGTEAVRVERHAPSRWGFRAGPPLNLTTLSAVCPDQLVLGAEEDTSSASSARVRVLGVVPSATPEATARLAQDVVVVDGLGNEPREGLVDRGDAHSLFVGDGLAVVVLGGSDSDEVPGTIGSFGTRDGHYLSAAPLSAARLDAQNVLVALRGGTLMTVRRTDR